MLLIHLQGEEEVLLETYLEHQVALDDLRRHQDSLVEVPLVQDYQERELGHQYFRRHRHVHHPHQPHREHFFYVSGRNGISRVLESVFIGKGFVNEEVIFLSRAA